MPLPSITIKEFVAASYDLISASSPTVPLYGNDTTYAIKRLNNLIAAYSGTGLLTTIAKEVVVTLPTAQQEVTFGSPLFTPLPDVTSEGRLSNLLHAWLLLQGVTYPLIDLSRDEFLDAYKFDPQLGLPRFAIVFNENNLTRLRLFPGPSQQFELHVYAKFEPGPFDENSNMSSLPDYFQRYFLFALARDLAAFKGRLSAWTQELRDLYKEAKQDMVSTSTINLAIKADLASNLNGAWRVKAGI